MTRQARIILLILLLIVPVYLFLDANKGQAPDGKFKKGNQVNQTVKKAKKKENKAFISEQEILDNINKIRKENQLSKLTSNSTLVQVASTRVFDMKDRDYFAHVSPLGESVHTVASSAAYAPLVLAENLAKGKFKDSEQLVKAWMDSPDHKNTILTPGFSDTGIAFDKNSKGDYIVVQIFGVPVSACPRVDPVLMEELGKNQALIHELGVEVDWETDDQDFPTVTSKDLIELIEVTRILYDSYAEKLAEYRICLDAVKWKDTQEVEKSITQ